MRADCLEHALAKTKKPFMRWRLKRELKDEILTVYINSILTLAQEFLKRHRNAILENLPLY